MNNDDFESRLRNEDSQAWKEWGEALKPTCNNYSGPLVNAGELLQEVARKLWIRIRTRTVGGRDEVFGLSHEMARCTAADWVRAANAKKRMPEGGIVSADEKDAEGEEMQIGSSGPLPCDDAQRNEIVRKMRYFLSCMKDKYCPALLTAHYLYEVPTKTLAEFREVAEGTIRSDIFRCLEALEIIIRKAERNKADKFWLKES